MATPIVSYRMAWNTESNQGRILIKLQGGEERRLNVNSSGEFVALATILREQPVFLHSNGAVVHTGWEPLED